MSLQYTCMYRVSVVATICMTHTGTDFQPYIIKEDRSHQYQYMGNLRKNAYKCDIVVH